MQKEKIRQKQKGITLIALIITIIVMLILVGVSVTVALKGGLFSSAQSAKTQTQEERDKELVLSEGKVEVNEKLYNSVDEYVNGSSGGEKVTILPKKETYNVGEEVTIGTEAFYVIADDVEKVTLLAKDCINTTNLVQSASAETIAFSSTNYWTSETGHNLNEYPIPDGVTSIITVAESYGVVKGGVGRLMSYSEAEKLNTDEYRDILNGTNGKSSSTSLNYWLSFADIEAGLVCVIDGIFGSRANFDNDSYYGVRPVIEISK